MTPRGAAPALDDASFAAALVDSIADLPLVLVTFGIALLLYTLALALHGAVSPQREFRQLRNGNGAAAVSLAGAMLGLALPLASVVAVSGALLDLVAWGVIALLLQVATVSILRRMVPSIGAQLEAGAMPAGIFFAAQAVVVGALNAAAMLF